MRTDITEAEGIILQRIGFQTFCHHPHAYLMCYLNQLGLTGGNSNDDEDVEKKRVCSRAWTYLNDSYRGNFMLIYTPSTIACAMIWLALSESDKLLMNLTTEPAWYQVFGASLEELENIAGGLWAIYKRPVGRDLPLTVAGLHQYFRNSRNAIK